MTNAARALQVATAFAAMLVFTAAAPGARATNHVADDTDRSAFQSWFTFLADAQFERTTTDVVDCASLVRHAYREALRPHSPEWYRRNQLPMAVAFPDVRSAPPIRDGAWLLFRVARDPETFAEFADAATLVRFNTRPVGRDVRAARPGDLLYFRQETSRSPDHLMIFVGESRFDPADGAALDIAGTSRVYGQHPRPDGVVGFGALRARNHDWIVYHTGPQEGTPGEVRKVLLRDLQHHPSPRWRPVRANSAFVGVFRLTILDRAR